MFLPGSSTRVIVTTQTTRNVVELDVVTGEVIASTPTGAGGSHNVAIARDGRTALTSNEADGTVSVLDLSTRSMLRKYTVGAPPAEGIAVTPDGREAWVALRGEQVVRVVDVTSGKVLATLSGLAIVALLQGGEVAIVDIEARRVLTRHSFGRRIDAAAWGRRRRWTLDGSPDLPLLRGGRAVGKSTVDCTRSR